MRCRLDLPVVCVIAVALVWGQGKRAPTPAERAKALLDEASAAPVEIFADIALSPKLLSLLPQKEKAAVLAAVFQRSGEAREPLPLRYAVPVRDLKGPDADREAAAALRLDALSIRCRVIQALLNIDPKLARRLFEEIARPEAPEANCADNLVPDTGIYLETLAAVAERGAFSDEERKKGAPWLLVESGLGRITGAWEITAAARELRKFAISESRAQVLSAGLGAAMAHSDSDRAFTVAVRQSGGMIGHVLQAVAALQQAGASDVPMLTALRGYLVSQLSGIRCRDNIGNDAKSADAPTIQAFNEYLVGRADIAAISAEEHTPLKLEGEAASKAYANAREFEATSEEVGKVAGLQVLRISSGSVSVAMRSAEPLEEIPQARARDALSRIEDLNPRPGQDPVEVFHQKCRLLGAVLTAPLSDESRRVATGEANSILEDPTILLRAPAEWLREVRYLLLQIKLFEFQRARDSGAGKEPAAVSEIASPLAASRLSALSLYSRIESFSASPR